MIVEALRRIKKRDYAEDTSKDSTIQSAPDLAGFCP
jgi:hypothetical protein